MDQKNGGERTSRNDFTFTTSNKQLNYLQHIYKDLKNNGNFRAAVIVPDTVLFEGGSGTQIHMYMEKQAVG